MKTLLKTYIIAMLVLAYAYAAKPNKPQWLWSTPSQATGTLSVKYNLWSGSKSTKFNLYANSILVAQSIATGGSGTGSQFVSAQVSLGAITVSARYNFIIEACNASGCTKSNARGIYITAGGNTAGGTTGGDTITVSSAVQPDEPHIIETKMENDTLNVKWQIWWGKSGDSVKLYFGDVLIKTKALSSYTSGNSGQTDTISATATELAAKGISSGTHSIRVYLCKSTACAKSSVKTIFLTVNATPTTPPVNPTPPENNTPQTIPAPKAPIVTSIATNIDGDFILKMNREQGDDLHKDEIIKLEHKIPSANITTIYTLGKANTFSKTFNVKVNFVAPSTFTNTGSAQTSNKTISGNNIDIQSDNSKALAHTFSFSICNTTGCTKVTTPLSTTITPKPKPKEEEKPKEQTPSSSNVPAPKAPEVEAIASNMDGDFTLKMNREEGSSLHRNEIIKLEHKIPSANITKVFTLGKADEYEKSFNIKVNFVNSSKFTNTGSAQTSKETIDGSDILIESDNSKGLVHTFSFIMCNTTGCTKVVTPLSTTITPKTPIGSSDPLVPQKPEISIDNAVQSGDGITPLTFTLKLKKPIGIKGTVWKIKHSLKDTNSVTTYSLDGANSKGANTRSFQSRNDPEETKDVIIKVAFTREEPKVHDALREYTKTVLANTIEIKAHNSHPKFTTHVFAPVLCNALGCSVSEGIQAVTINYTGNLSEYAPKPKAPPTFTQAPQAPTMSTLNASYTSNFNITLSKLIGTSGTKWKLEHKILEANRVTTYDLGTAVIPESDDKGTQTKQLSIKVSFSSNAADFTKKATLTELNVDASSEDSISIKSFSGETLTHIFTPILCNSIGCTKATTSKTTYLSDPSQKGKPQKDEQDRYLEKLSTIAKVTETQRSKNLNLDKSTWDQVEAAKTGKSLKEWKLQIQAENASSRNINRAAYQAPSPKTCSNVSNGKINGKESMTYFASWAMYGRKHYPRDIDGCKYTGVLFAFAYPAPNGRLYIGDGKINLVKQIGKDSTVASGSKYSDDPKLGFYGGLNQLIQFKKEYPHIKTYLSVGGWTWSTYVAAMANNPEVKRVFIADTIKILRTFQFDGIDLDWEFPANKTDRDNLTSLFTDLRAALDAAIQNPKPGFEFSSDEAQKKFIYKPANNKFTLSLAVSPNPVKNIQFVDLAKINPLVDFVLLMGYDYAGSWDSKTGHLTPLYTSGKTGEAPHKHFNASSAINAYTNGEVSTTNPSGFNNLGFDSDKIILGLGYYGRGWETNSKEVYQQVGAGKAPVGSWENGAIDYSALVEAYKADRSNWTLIWDKKAKAPMAHGLYTPKGKAAKSYDTKGKTPKRAMWSYDDQKSICEKVNYIKTKNLGGTFGWESSSDNGDLIDSTIASLKGTIDCDTTYPDSNYDVIYDGNGNNDDTADNNKLTNDELDDANKLLEKEKTKQKGTQSNVKSLGAWVKGFAYKTGDIVGSGTQYYKCNPWPYEGWCSSREPGFGNGWGQAWTEFQDKAVVVAAPSIENINNKILSSNTLIKSFNVKNTGGATQSCTISPPLTQGLNFNTSTCEISGTPSKAEGQTTYTITATNTAGNASATVGITINKKFVITGQPILSAQLNALYTFIPTVDVANKNNVSFRIINKPSWLTFDRNSGKLEGTPTVAGNTQGIIISATYNGATASLNSFIITMQAPKEDKEEKHKVELLNIANLHGIATQVQQDDASRKASLAIDGDYSTMNYTGNGSENKWLQIEIPLNSKIDSIKVYNSTTSPQKLSGAKLYLLDTPYSGVKSSLSGQSVLHTYNGAETQEWKNKANISKKYILISDSAENLSLREVEVYGTLPEGLYVEQSDYKFTIDKSDSITKSIGRVLIKDYHSETVTYSIEDSVISSLFKIDTFGLIYAKSALTEAKKYTFNVKGTNGTQSILQEVQIEITDTQGNQNQNNQNQGNQNNQVIQGVVGTKFKTGDSTPRLTGKLPSDYASGDTIKVTIDSKTYTATASGSIWTIANDQISPLATGNHSIAVQRNNGPLTAYRDYLEIVGSRYQKSNIAVSPKQIEDVNVQVTYSISKPLAKDKRVRSTSTWIIKEGGGYVAVNDSFRIIKSLIAYTGSGSNKQFVRLIFNQPIQPYSRNVISGIPANSTMTVFPTMLTNNDTISFGEKRKCTERSRSGLTRPDKCLPTTRLDTPYSYKSAFNSYGQGRPSEQQVYTTVLGGWNHLYNTVDGINMIHAYIAGRDYKNVKFSKDVNYPSYKYSPFVGRVDDYSAKFFMALAPNHEMVYHALRYRWNADGLAIMPGRDLFSEYTIKSWASVWESRITFAGRYRNYIWSILEHENMHVRGFDHDTGMTYGWVHAAGEQYMYSKHSYGATSTFNAPKYFFDITDKTKSTLDIKVYKTSDANNNKLTFETFSASIATDKDFIVKHISDNKLKVTISSNVVPRFFLRVYGEDSNEFASRFISQSMMAANTISSPAPAMPISEIVRLHNATSGKFFSHSVDITNPNIIFSIKNKPDWLNFDANSGKISGTPTSSDTKEWKDITISFTSQNKTFDLPSFSILVTSNITSKAKVTQSPNTDPDYRGPENLVDGNLETTNYTTETGNSWVQLEMPAGTKIGSIRVYNSIKQDYHLTETKLYILDTPHNGIRSSVAGKTVHHTFNTDPIQEWTNTTKVSGKYILIYARAGNYINLKEIEVYGTTP